MIENNPFKNKASNEAPKQEAAPVAETPKSQIAATQPSGRKLINEETMDDSNWINLPTGEELNIETPIVKIAVDGYYQQEGKEFKNKQNEVFYSGLTTENSDGTKNRVGEFILEGSVEGQAAKCRISNWELVYKMGAFVKYCKTNNLTVANQEVSFLRINTGKKNAGKNWILNIHGNIQKKVERYDNKIVDM